MNSLSFLKTIEFISIKGKNLLMLAHTQANNSLNIQGASV